MPCLAACIFLLTVQRVGSLGGLLCGGVQFGHRLFFARREFMPPVETGDLHLIGADPADESTTECYVGAFLNRYPQKNS